MAQTQPFGFACLGGLDINQSQFVLQQQQAGTAVDLVNFEVDSDGGYRRISGHSLLAAGRINGDSSLNTKIHGLVSYTNGGVIAAIGTDIYLADTTLSDGTHDANTFIKINRSGGDAPAVTGGDDYSAFTALSVAARTSQDNVRFAIYETATDPEIVIFDGVNAPLHFKATAAGEHSTKTYWVTTITVNTGTIAGTNPAFGIIHQNRLVTSGDSSNPNTVFYSEANDIDDFTNGGSITLEDKVVGLKSFRGDIIIFCEDSIQKLVDINGTPAIVPITKQIGCLATDSIQELGGDLIFLAPDGIRTIAATARIGDTELGTVSRQIQPLIVNNIVSDINNLTVKSTVLRRKNQYRLYYSNQSDAQGAGKGITGTLTSNGFAWSELDGFAVTATESTYNHEGIESVFHGTKDGYLLNSNIDTSNVFKIEGSDVEIISTYTTPHLDFGDLATRKTLNFVRLDIKAEGTVTPLLGVSYDNGDGDVAQPAIYTTQTIHQPSLFNEGKFGDNIFDSPKKSSEKQPVQGSGHNVSFTIQAESADNFIINGIYVDYYPSGRR